MWSKRLLQKLYVDLTVFKIIYSSIMSGNSSFQIDLTIPELTHFTLKNVMFLTVVSSYNIIIIRMITDRVLNNIKK